MNHQPAIVRWSIPLTVSALIILALLPVRWTSRLQWFSEQAEVVIAPVSAPITRLTSWIIPATGTARGLESEEERALRDELDRVQTQLYREREINRQLTTLVDQLQRGANLTPDIDVRQIHRPRIGTTGDLLVIRSGTDDGLHRNTVAVVEAVQLLGRVSVADKRTSKVLPITSASALPIMGTVMLDENGQYQLRCLLTPIGDGNLRGAITPSTDPDFPTLQPGMEVRLLDDQWPRHAQMLVVGTILRITEAPNQPLRREIIVQPGVDLRVVPEVIFRLPEQDGGFTP
jgi:hypothetical protein